jgi:hypothetical protein
MGWKDLHPWVQLDQKDFEQALLNQMGLLLVQTVQMD